MSIAGLGTDGTEALRATSAEGDALATDAFASTLEAGIADGHTGAKHEKRASHRPKTPEGAPVAAVPILQQTEAPEDPAPSLSIGLGSRASEGSEGNSTSVATPVAIREASRTQSTPMKAEDPSTDAPDRASLASSDSTDVAASSLPLPSLAGMTARASTGITQPVPSDSEDARPNPAISRARAAYGAAELRPSNTRASTAEATQAGATQTVVSTEFGGDALPSVPGANPVTGVNTPSPAAAATRVRLRQALTSAVNQAVLRRSASGEINHPELGRVIVRAQTRAGAVDVDVQSDHAETRGILHGTVAAMAGDLREGDIPLGTLQVLGDSSGFSGSAADRPGGAAGDKSRDRADAESNNDENERPGARGRRRVRIVL